MGVVAVGDTFTQGSKLTLHIDNDMRDVELHETLGVGCFGVVSRAVDGEGGWYAVKSIRCATTTTTTWQMFQHELHLLLSLNHSNIVRMHGMDFHNDTAIMVMEYCSDGTLNRRLDEHGRVEPTQQLQWMEQLTIALTYLHDNNILHRNLKPDNVLISHSQILKLADFAVAKHFVGFKRGHTEPGGGYISEYLDCLKESFAGTPFWLAPEVFDLQYEFSSDVFSLGVIFHAICERQCCVYEGDRYYGSFVDDNDDDNNGDNAGNLIPIGLHMFQQQQQQQPVFASTSTTPDKLRKTISSMLHFRAPQRLSLIDVRVEISEVYCEVLHGSEDGRPPLLIDTPTTSNPRIVRTSATTSSSSRGVMQSLCCCYRDRRKYEGYNQLL